MTDYTPAQQRLIEQHRDINTEHDWWDCCYEQFIERCKAFGIEIATTTETFYSKRQGKEVSYQRPQLYFDLYRQGADVYFATESFTILELIEAGRELMTRPKDHDDAWMQDSEDGVVQQLRDNFERLEREFGTRLLSAELRAVLNECTFNTKIRHESIRVDAGFDPYSEGDATSDQLELADALQNDWPDAIEEMLRDVARAFHEELESEYESLQEDDAVWDSIVANDLHLDLDEDEEEAA